MTKEEILAQHKAGQLTTEQLAEALDKLDRPARGSLYCKVSPKGALSLYGLQRMPVTLYVEQWERLFGFGEEIRAFMQQHNHELKRKER
jgi:hypothetical protein